MKNIVLATAVAVALSLACEQAGAQSRGAASRSDLEAVQEQLQALTERLNRLEAANTEVIAAWTPSSSRVCSIVAAMPESSLPTSC